jgi:hypothetical protein
MNPNTKRMLEQRARTNAAAQPRIDERNAYVERANNQRLDRIERAITAYGGPKKLGESLGRIILHAHGLGDLTEPLTAIEREMYRGLTAKQIAEQRALSKRLGDSPF